MKKEGISTFSLSVDDDTEKIFRCEIRFSVSLLLAAESVPLSAWLK